MRILDGLAGVGEFRQRMVDWVGLTDFHEHIQSKGD